jgi:PAS domain S-box-containing protein
VRETSVSYLAKVALLAALYFLAGKLGLSLAVPPGYATIIWPPSGIALGMLLVHGRGLAPGVFLGSFLLNALVGHAPQELPTVAELLLATGIAAGSTLQALVGHALVVRWFGLPVRMRRVGDILRVLLVAGPLTCLVAASCGVTSLYLLGDLPGAGLADNWFTWWTGDLFGVLVFLPLTLVLSGRAVLVWRERAVRGLQAISVVLLVLPLGLTFFAWKSLAETTHRQSQAQFESLAKENEQALNARLAAYGSAARSGAGIVQSSVFVSLEEWRTFIGALRLREDYPGMMGLGWIDRDKVVYLEPGAVNGVPVGLDIDSHAAIRAAADRATTSGMPALSAPFDLGPDEDTAPGFVLLQPVYRSDMPLGGVSLRRHALRGFVFTPFQARGFFADLTPSQGRRLDVSLYGAGSHEVIFSTRLAHANPRYTVRRDIDVAGSTWTVEWQSTVEFERTQHNGGAHFVLFGGLLFTGMFAVLLLAFGTRRRPVELKDALDKPWILPLATFVMVTGASCATWALLASAESAHVSSQVENETRRLEAGLDRAVVDRLQAVRRMAHRWSSGGGTSYAVWRNDARDLVRQLPGLERLQWIGPDYHLHWSEGSRRSGWVEREDVRSTTGFGERLRASAERGTTLVTEPREFEAGESAFDVYVPVTREGKFDGFIGATFSSREFFGDLHDAAGSKSFTFAARFGGRTYFQDAETAAGNPEWTREGGFKINELRWTFTLAPTRQFVDEQQTVLPLIVLFAGLLIASLSAVLVRFVLLSRLKAARLQASTRALATSEQRYELALRGMSVGLFDWDITTNDVFLSQRCRDILRITDPAFAPKYTGFTARLHPEDRSRVEKALFGHLKRLHPFEVEFRMRRDDGDYVWVHSYGQAQYDADGYAVRMAGSLQDITAQKQQEQQLERSSAQLRLLVENAPVAVAMFDCEMRYLMTSRRWMQDYGLEGRDIIGQSHYDVFPEIRSVPHFIDIHRRALRGERFDNREDSWTRADGQKVWSQWAIHPWLDADGAVGGIILFTEDITARKQSEAALRTTEAMNRAAMDKAPIGKALVRPDGRFMKVNPALCLLLGYSENDLLATDFQAITHPDDLAADLAHLRDLLDGRTVSYQMEKRYFHRDGRVVWVQLSVSLVRRADGAVDFLVAQIQDITERKNIERMKDEFIAVVGHELRAPLSAIRDSLGEIAAARDATMPDSLQHVFDNAHRNCERLGSLVEEILDLEKIAGGQMRFDFKDEQIATITRHVVSVNEAYSRISLAEIDPGWTVYVDTARYGQALSSLLSNAAKFSPAGSRIEVGAELRGDWVRVFVRDQGEGIPDEFRSRIFGKFSQADPLAARQKGGAGLGLYVTRQLVEQMRGSIGFASVPGAGTTFWLEFPRVTRSERRLTA